MYKPIIQWSPKLDVEEEAKRRYTIYGKGSLDPGEEWRSPASASDRFFKVEVEMK